MTRNSGKKAKPTSHLNLRPEGRKQWGRSFEENEGVPELLKQLAEKGVDVERLRTLLYAAPMLGSIKSRAHFDRLRKDLAAAQTQLKGAANLLRTFPFPRKQHNWILGMLDWLHSHLEEHRQMMAKWRSAFTTIQATDLVIAIVAQDLERAGSRRVNEDIATLLTAAAVPGGTRDAAVDSWAWDAATVDKRRDRLKRKPVMALSGFRHLFLRRHRGPRGQ